MVYCQVEHIQTVRPDILADLNLELDFVGMNEDDVVIVDLARRYQEPPILAGVILDALDISHDSIVILVVYNRFLDEL